MAGKKKTTKKAPKAKKVLSAPVPETEPEFEELAKEDVATAQQAQEASESPEVKAAVEQAVEVAKTKAKKGPLTIEDVKELLLAATKNTVEQMMPAVASAIIQANVPRVAGAVAQVPGNYRPPLRRCYLCQQDERVCGAKEENHVKMVVGPRRYPEFGKWFRGAGINGVWYRSDHPNHKIVVPKAAIGSILAQVEAFEEDERQTGQKRYAEHNSGGFADPEFGGHKTRKATERSGWR